MLYFVFKLHIYTHYYLYGTLGEQVKVGIGISTSSLLLPASRVTAELNYTPAANNYQLVVFLVSPEVLLVDVGVGSRKWRNTRTYTFSLL